MPLRHVWTTNYDRLIERAYAAIRRPCDVVSAAADLALRATPGAARIYKMHGSVDRLDDVVISTDDYELFRHKRGAFLPLLQAHLTSFSMLFVGLSFSDPNLRHVLSLIRESFTDAPPSHFAIVRAPHRADYKSDQEFKARLKQHELWARDLRRYGLYAVEIDDYSEVPGLLRQIERRVASRRVWISGSWPLNEATTPSQGFVHAVSKAVGEEIAHAGLALVSGSGLLVGSGGLSGFLSVLQTSGGWDLERRLIVRPFPQPISTADPDRSQWDLLRSELARLSGTVVFVGGLKATGGILEEADGVHAEMRLAEQHGAFLIPIGATAGAAETIAKALIGGRLAYDGPAAQRPTDAQLSSLMDKSVTPEELAKRVAGIIRARVN